jgi:O-antigen ligase
VRALLVALVPVVAMVALGGAYPSATLPLLILAAAAAATLLPLSIAGGGHRVLDIALIAFLAAIALQLLPLPADVVSLLSPNALPVHDRLYLSTGQTMRTLSIDTALTRAALASAATALLVFWAARDAFGRGGVRAATRLVMIAGLALAFAGMAHRATAPETLLWWWTPLDPGAKPIGPFVNRNDFAAWLLLASSVTIGFAVMHARSYGLMQNPSARLTIKNILADGTGLMFGGAAVIMLLALIAALSRGALLGAAAAIACGYWLSRQRSIGQGRSARVGALLLAVVLAAGVVLNLDAIVRRLAGGTEVSRMTIWRETLPIIADFPVTGTGLGTFPRSMLIYQRTSPDVLFNHAHSEYLQLPAEGGLLLTIPAVVALAAWLALARRRLRDDRREMLWIRIAAAAGMAGVAVQCVWDATLRMPATALLFALLAGLVVHEGQRSEVRGQR